ncbi:peptide deformylase [Patescibacteria group bacterium]|nr:peptide deformylase [Patescibacteria group bacterium]
MAVVETTQAGNPIIRRISEPVTEVNSEEIQQIIQNLIDSMREQDLVGMAAPQIEQNLRMFVTEIRETKYRKEGIDSLKVFMNPEIVEKSGEQNTGYEGCGSVAFAGLFGPVKRSKSVRVKALDKDGSPFELEADGLLAVVIQHEADHLDGILFIDKVTDTRELMSRNEYLKFRGRDS